LRAYHGQPGSYQLAGRVSTDKRAWSHAFPGTHLILELSRYADLPGGSARTQGTTEERRKTGLTLTGLLMEGLSPNRLFSMSDQDEAIAGQSDFSANLSL